MSDILWTPSADRIEAAQLTAFMRHLNATYGLTLGCYEDVRVWSNTAPQAFWSEIWDYCGVVGDKGGRIVDNINALPGAVWFPDGALNFAENLLRPRNDAVETLVFWGEHRVKRRLDYAEVVATTSRIQQALAAAGIRKGDRVAAYMPNMPETVLYMLATVSLGAVWSSASPDFGVQGAVDRFAQIRPKLLLAADGYFYNDKWFDVGDKVAAIAAGLPSVETLTVVGYQGQPQNLPIDGALSHEDFIAPHDSKPLCFHRVSSAHPLCIVFSSGTTGAPKCIVHSHGGTLVQHLKEHILNCDHKAGDRVFFFTTCGWMMWNWLVSSVAAKATVLLYDGAPLHRDGLTLLDYAAAEGATTFGVSAKWIGAIAKAGLCPRDSHDLSAVRLILSTGSPLAPDSFDYVYGAVKSDVHLASISGGTDILSCFMLGNPVGAVRRGEIQARALGMNVQVLGDDGTPVPPGVKGELACGGPFPAAPIGFWNDPDGQRYKDAYFNQNPGYWTHGDWVEVTPAGGIVVHGRSDATLNPGGVRIGTAEIYRQVEASPEILESVVVGQDWHGDVRVILFVKLRDGLTLADALVSRVKDAIRKGCTPRHVPDKVLQVDDIPRTKSGKIVELAVRACIHSRAIKNLEALSNPEALEDFKNRDELAF